MNEEVRISQEGCSFCNKLADWSCAVFYKTTCNSDTKQYVCTEHLEDGLTINLYHGFRSVDYFEVIPLVWDKEVDY